MKTEFVTLSPFGVAGLLVAGCLISQWDLLGLLLGGLTLLAVWENAKQPFQSGNYRARFGLWRRVGDLNKGTGGKVVPFKGPAA